MQALQMLGVEDIVEQRFKSQGTFGSVVVPITAMAALASFFGFTGKEIVMLEEVANLVRRGYKAICPAGYDEQSSLPNWCRLSDRLENIEPDTN